MTTISPASVQRPPNLPSSASPLRSLKRQASRDANQRADDKAFKHPAEETPASKRPKVNLSGEAASSSVRSFTDPGPTISNKHNLARAQDARKLPLEFVNGFFVGSEGISEVQPPSPLAVRSNLPSLPQRPWRYNLLARKMTEGTLNNSGVRKRDDLQVQSVPYKTEPPGDAPKLGRDSKQLKINSRQNFSLIEYSAETADFAPWMANHPEDVLNEQTVKHGFIDKVPVSHNETNTARQSLYGLFKHKSGLQTLSALFATIMEERQVHSKVSSNSAFKPPPRVTLTEAKRRAWLSDLANPHVPLRKLNRTIPQGIRGQSLLEQCFINNIPPGRALWFAKCVGANEIRTLKRKGTNASFSAGVEIKWLRDWTTNVEQFLESSIEQCGQADWRQKMIYALNIAVRLYSDFLLDRDHYLEWIVKAIPTTSLDQLPVWLLMVSLHDADLVQHRRRGRMLAESLLEKLHTAMEHEQSPLAPLLGRMKQILRKLMQIKLSCFVLPQSWKKFKGTVEQSLNLHFASDRHVLQQLFLRNERLSNALGYDSESRTPQQHVLSILDSASSPFRMNDLAQGCRAAFNDIELLIHLVLEWCSSKFRSGRFRVYLAVSLVKTWQYDVDMNSVLIDFFAAQQTATACDIHCLCLLVSELVRARIFSLSRYMQWLTARGGLARDSLHMLSSGLSTSTENKSEWSTDPAGFNPADILTAVPLSTLPSVVKNFRNISLARAGFSLDEEASLMRSCRDYITRKLPRFFWKYEAESSSVPCEPDFTKLSWSLRFETAHFLQHHIASFTSSSGRSTSKGNGQGALVSLTLNEFCMIRRILEDLGELAILADIILLCTKCDDEKLLASVADTVSFHLDDFSALGVLADLHQRIFQAYSTVRANGGLPRQYLVSLISLGSVVPSNLISVWSLQQDLARGDRSVAVAACSPVSDGMAESLQQAGPAFTEEFEAVLSTGNRMEAQTMTQLFHVLSERLEKGQYQTEAENDEILCALHARLRIYRIAQFDALISGWLERLLQTTKSRVKQLLPILISTGCLCFEACMDIFAKVLPVQEDDTPGNALRRAHAAGFLEMIASAEHCIDPISYKLKTDNARHIKEHPDCAFDVRVRTGQSIDGSPRQISNDLLINVVLKGKALDVLPTAGSTAEAITGVLDSLLELSQKSSNFAFSELVNRTTHFSMRFCRLRLQFWAANTSLSSATPGQENIVDTLFDLAKSQRDGAWMYYVSATGHEITCQVREKAEEAFFAEPIPTLLGRNNAASPAATSTEQASIYLRIVRRTADSISPSGSQVILPHLVERFALVLRYFNSAKVPASNDSTKPAPTQSCPNNEETTPANLDQLISYLILLLQMTCIHRTAFISTRPEPLSSPLASQKQTQHDVVKVLVFLISIAMHPALVAADRELTIHIFDIAAMIVDDTFDEVRMRCAKVLKDKMREPMAEYLLGSANNATSSHRRNTDDGSGSLILFNKDSKKVGDYKPRNWEMLEGGAEASISLSLFDARREG